MTYPRIGGYSGIVCLVCCWTVIQGGQQNVVTARFLDSHHPPRRQPSFVLQRRNKLFHHQDADSLRLDERKLMDVSLSTLTAPMPVPSLLLELRGGGGSDADEIAMDSGASSSFVVTKLRNIIRSMLKICDRKSPTLSSALRSLVKALESVLGVDLLPAAKKKNKNKKSSKKKAKSTIKEEVEQEEEVKTKEPKKKKASSVAAAATTAKQLNEKLSAKSPNYRIQKELKAFIKDPPPNLSVKFGKNLRVWIVTMTGAKNSIYEGEVFKLRVSFPAQYPTVPPSVYFLPPNIPYVFFVCVSSL